MYIASINLRINVDVDGLNAWPYRKKKMIDFILNENFDFVGCQEASPLMISDLTEGIGHLYDVVFEPRDERGESTPIFYKKTNQPVACGTKWLTDTPNVLSQIKGSHFPRIVTYARFKDVLLFNTHLDYASDDVCHKQATFLVDIIKHIAYEKEPIVITGDFNMKPHSKTISYMKTEFKTCYHQSSDDLLTYHAFSDETKGQPIDYIFYSNHLYPERFNIHHHEKKHVYMSDHYPISVRFKRI